MTNVIKETLNFLDQNNISYEMLEHEAVYTVDDIKRIGLKIDGVGIKTLFLRNQKGDNFYLIAIKDDKQIDLKKLAEKLGEKRFSFASEKYIDEFVPEVRPGSFTPLAIIFNKQKNIKLAIDEELLNSEKIAMHPNKNTATLILDNKNFRRVLELLGDFIKIKI